MPMPPPPAAAFTISGKPISWAAATAASTSCRGSVVPAATGTPAAAIVLRALTLSPMRSIASGSGPIHTSPASFTAAANRADSDRKP